MTLIQDGGGTETELFLSDLSSSLDQDATIQFSHERFIPPDALNPESGDYHPEIAPFVNIEQPVSLFSSMHSSYSPCVSDALYLPIA
jgi:hypothetical protein